MRRLEADRTCVVSADSQDATWLDSVTMKLPDVLFSDCDNQLGTFPRQHHSVTDGQAYVLDSRICFHELIKGNDRMIVA
jgi:hypothetical protein